MTKHFPEIGANREQGTVARKTSGSGVRSRDRAIARNDGARALRSTARRKNDLRSARLGGRSLRYGAELNGEWVALICLSGTPPPHVQAREQWRGWSVRQRAGRLGLVVNRADPLAFDVSMGQWIIDRALAILERLAVDGKTRRGSAPPRRLGPAVVPSVQTTAAPERGAECPEEKSNDIPAYQPLLETYPCSRAASPPPMRCHPRKWRRATPLRNVAPTTSAGSKANRKSSSSEPP